MPRKGVLQDLPPAQEAMSCSRIPLLVLVLRWRREGKRRCFGDFRFPVMYIDRYQSGIDYFLIEPLVFGGSGSHVTRIGAAERGGV